MIEGGWDYYVILYAHAKSTIMISTLLKIYILIDKKNKQTKKKCKELCYPQSWIQGSNHIPKLLLKLYSNAHHEKPSIFLWIVPRNLPMCRSILLKIFRFLTSIIMSCPPFCLNARVLQLPYSIIHKRHPWSYLCVIATGDTFKWFQYYYFNLNGCIRQESSSSICLSSHFKRLQCATICATTANISHYAQWHQSCCFLK